MNRNPRSWLPLLLTLFVIALDRFTKRLVDATMDLGESIPFLGDVVRWTYIHNYGMAFGMQLTGGAMLGYISILAVIVIIFVMMRTPPRNMGTRWVLAAILGGAIGNTYDRLVHGYVIDFIDVDLPDFLMDRWPVFNVADSAVSVGVVLLVLMMIFNRDPETAGSVAPVEGQQVEPGEGYNAVEDHDRSVSTQPVSTPGDVAWDEPEDESDSDQMDENERREDRA